MDRKRGAEEEWMDEDDLLGVESKEVDLRNKLQRNQEGKQGPSQLRREEMPKPFQHGGRGMDPNQRRFGDREFMGRNFLGDFGRGGRGATNQSNFALDRRNWNDSGHGDQGFRRGSGRGGGMFDFGSARGNLGHGNQNFGRGGRESLNNCSFGRGARFEINNPGFNSTAPSKVDSDSKRKEEFKRKQIEQGQSKDMRCFRCQDYGHHQADCKKEPTCYKCKQPGHMASECEGLNGHKLRMFGFGIKQGFYSIEIPKLKS